MFSIDCFLNTQGTVPGGSVVFVKAIFALMFPIGAILVFLGVFGVIFCKERSRELYKRRMIVSCISFMFLVHPTLTDLAFGLFNCYQIDETWL